MKFPFIKKPIFKSKEQKWKEKLMKDYEEGKVLKIEKPSIQDNQNRQNNQPNQPNQNNQNNNHAHNQKKKHKHWRN